LESATGSSNGVMTGLSGSRTSVSTPRCMKTIHVPSVS